MTPGCEMAHLSRVVVAPSGVIPPGALDSDTPHEGPNLSDIPALDGTEVSRSSRSSGSTTGLPLRAALTQYELESSPRNCAARSAALRG